MAAENVFACAECGKAFARRPSKPDQKYCGVPCYRAAQRRGVYVRGPEPTTHRQPCEQCGTLVVRMPGKNRKGERSDKVFCSRPCYDQYRIEQRGFCVHCGSRIPGMRSKGKYCGWSCRVEAKRPKPRNCVNCSCLFTPVKPMMRRHGIKFIAHDAGKTCAKACEVAWRSNNEDRKRKISIAFKGSNHPNWEGGKSYENRSYRGADWEKISAKIRKRDGYCCTRCGLSEEENGRRLDVHHIEPFHNFKSIREANRSRNLTSLCQRCHRIVEWEIEERQMVLPFAASGSSLSRSSRKKRKSSTSRSKKTRASSSAA